MSNLDKIDIREEYYQEVYNMSPNWWMRRGISVVFLILFVMLFLSYVIKYPDTIQSEFRLSTDNPSITLPSLTKKRIQTIFVKNNSSVKANDHLLVFANDSDYDDIMFLEKNLKDFSFNREFIIPFFEKSILKNMQLGHPIEQNWYAFSNLLLEFYNIKELASYENRIEFLDEEIQKQLELKKHFNNLVLLDEKQRILQDEKLKVDSILLSKGVLSRNDFRNSRANYLVSKRKLQQNQLSMERANLELVRLNNKVEGLKIDENITSLKLELNIREAYNRLMTSIKQWKTENLFISNIAGTVSYIQDIKSGGFYKGDIIVISPLKKEFYALLQIPFTGAGKVEESSKTILKIYDYPYREFGNITGKITELNSVAGENFYLGKVAIDTKAKTTYNKKIVLKENMTGIGEIITKDRSILERLFEKLIYAFNA